MIIEEDLRQFIFHCIDSAEQLEVLLFLYEHPGSWTVERISEALRSTPSSIEKRLRSLNASHLIEQDERKNVQFSNVYPELERLVGKLAEAYRQRKSKVLELIFSPAKKAQILAGAFVLGDSKGKKNGEDDG